MNEPSFYSSGLRFSCTRCSSCCRFESGFVYLSEKDLSTLAGEFGMDFTAFVKTRCRWIPLDRGTERLSLREKSNFDCIFWDKGCTVYKVRPLQCRAYPFWDSVICSEQAWNETGKNCPGINSGTLHEKEEIESFLHQLDEEPVIERRISQTGSWK